MQNTVHLLCWSGAPEVAEREVRLRYPGCAISFVNQREFRESGSRGQFRELRGLRGRALVYFFSAPGDNRIPQVLSWSGLVHRCGETVVATGTGEWKRYRRSDWPRMLPKALLSATCDLFVLAFTWVLLHLLRRKPVPIEKDVASAVYLAYLFPFPLDQTEVGGASTHVQGFLSGLASIGGTAHVYSARPFVLHQFPITVIPGRRKFYLFHELVTLSF